MLNLETCDRFIKENELIKKEDMIVLGVSGGADSISLLHILSALREALEIRLFVVHINHGIRGEEAKRDEEFVREFCVKSNVECFRFHYNIPQMVQTMRISEEEAGRKARYEAFYKTAEDIASREKINISQIKIAIAHNKNDNAETILHNLSRGSGISGLKGIPAKSGGLIRPLIGFDRNEIEEYLEKNKIPYVTDSTNLENNYTRNILRNNIFPILKEEVNNNVINNFYKSSRVIAEADEYFEETAKNICVKNLQKTAEGDFILNKEVLKPHIIATYIIRHTLREILKTDGFGIKDIGMIHIEDVLNLAQSENGKKIDLKYSIKVYNEYRNIRFVKKINESSQSVDTCINSFSMRYSILDEFDIKDIPKDKNRKWFDFDKVIVAIVKYNGKSTDNVNVENSVDFVKENIVIRSKKVGDFIHIKDGKKTVRKLLTDEKIPAKLRDKYIVAAAGSDVLWIFKITDDFDNENKINRIGSLYKVDEGTKRVLEMAVQ